jgi:hypothetical protein
MEVLSEARTAPMGNYALSSVPPLARMGRPPQFMKTL